MTEKIKNVCEFYAITHKLKNTLRSGWQLWRVDADRFESVAEHIYGTQMLALAINCEFDLGFDMAKIALMLAIHEVGESIIGDVPRTGSPYTKEQKQKMEMEAVTKILGGICNSEKLMELFIEFEENNTREARFCNLIDRLECGLQIKYYEEQGCVDFAKDRPQACKDKMQPFIDEGITTLSGVWLTNYIRTIFGQDEVIKSIAQFAIENKIFETH